MVLPPFSHRKRGRVPQDGDEKNHHILVVTPKSAEPPRVGEMVAITGTIETNGQDVYVRADNVIPEG